MNSIKNLVDKKLWLAPLAGHTDSAFRSICKMCGADVITTEMVSSDGLIYNRNKSETYADFSNKQRPIGIQLFGNNPFIMAKATEIMLEKKPDFIDINMGCPVKKVVKKGAGSALMQTPEIAKNIVIEMKKALAGTKIILSAKIRSGWDFDSINYHSFGQMLQDVGIDLITLHPRTRSQKFSGISNWEHIKKLKEKCSIPIVGNGDILNVKDANKMFASTKCDSIMIGRGILGQPWLFNQIKENNTNTIKTTKKLEIIKNHYELTIANKGEKLAILEMRSHLSHYSKGYHNSSSFRGKVNQLLDYQKIIEQIEVFFNDTH
ncbi:MAG: tRNA dihydrouridine synthase DusB [Candidatus Cloacimonadota bacterium]|nr:tRNA dihydrouridine synthase DusB [Candidatus Cloacimonadota bacterium]